MEENLWVGVRPKWWFVVSAGVFLLIAFAIFAVVPQHMVDDSLIAKDRLKAENDIRSAGLQLLAGIGLGLGAVFTGITLVFNREQQITERFSRAIDQLGHEKLDVRLGGIYSLERIAYDSGRERTPVLEVLAAYVKEREPTGLDVAAANDVLARLR